MNSKIFYKTMAKIYDLLDVIYFRNYSASPRKAVFETIENGDSVLDLCTGTAANAIKMAKGNPWSKVIGIDLSKRYFKNELSIFLIYKRSCMKKVKAAHKS